MTAILLGNNRPVVHTAYTLKLIVHFLAGPVNPLTPAAVEAVLGAENARKLSAEIRQESWMMADNTSRIQQAVHRTVNQGLTQKLAQTVTLAVRIKLVFTSSEKFAVDTTNFDSLTYVAAAHSSLSWQPLHKYSCM